jgi:hypothetical protein
LFHRGALVGLVTVMLMPASLVAAHQGESQATSGVLVVLVNETRELAIAGMVPSDTLEWNWSKSGGQLAAELVWLDKQGEAHRMSSQGLPYGRFQAPPELASAHLEWKNNGSTDAVVSWNYFCSASFWTQPDLVLPAAIPIILLGAALVGGKVVDTRRKRAPPKE